MSPPTPTAPPSPSASPTTAATLRYRRLPTLPQRPRTLVQTRAAGVYFEIKRTATQRQFLPLPNCNKKTHLSNSVLETAWMQIRFYAVYVHLPAAILGEKLANKLGDEYGVKPLYGFSVCKENKNGGVVTAADKPRQHLAVSQAINWRDFERRMPMVQHVRKMAETVLGLMHHLQQLSGLERQGGGAWRKDQRAWVTTELGFVPHHTYCPAPAPVPATAARSRRAAPISPSQPMPSTPSCNGESRQRSASGEPKTSGSGDKC